MLEALDKLMLAGLGALSMTRERAEKIFDELLQRGQTARDARTGFVREVMDTADKARKDLQELVDRQVEKALQRLNLASREDLRRLEEKLDALRKADT